MPKIAEAVRAARREQIIAAGLACFARSGYHATTMADVAAQAGVSKGTPYLYFDRQRPPAGQASNDPRQTGDPLTQPVLAGRCLGQVPGHREGGHDPNPAGTSHRRQTKNCPRYPPVDTHGAQAIK
jgi:hypothetical protein